MLYLYDIELNPKPGRNWRIRIGGTVKVVNKDRFLCSFLAAAQRLLTLQTEGGSAALKKAANATYNYYYNQLDPENSDILALAMYRANEWKI